MSSSARRTATLATATTLALAAAGAGRLAAEPDATVAPAPGPARVALAPGEQAAITARLVGQRYHVDDDGRTLWIDDVAGDGPPRVGIVRRDGAALVLQTEAETVPLVGPLARPRIAGPGYTVWVIGDIMPRATGGRALQIRRLGVLRRPR
ncbi:MAG: hypothetical protein H6709_08605 [Kofleriaceae bacterium]|nr:hypothetical protein [Kofleriaceae bacterium]